MNVLAELEVEMAAEGDVAVQRLYVAWEALEAADARLATLTRPTWGGVVDDWHVAVEAVTDAASTVEAYAVFPPAG